jgi:hypothetical protein
MIERGRPRSDKLLTSLISDWQYGGTGTSTSPETEEFEATHPSLETEKRRRQFTLAVRTARSRLPELESEVWGQSSLLTQWQDFI